MSHLQSVGGEGINPVVSSGFVVFLDPCLGWSASQVDFHFCRGWNGETTHKHGFLQDVQDSLDPSDWPSLESNTHLNCLEGSGTFEVYRFSIGMRFWAVHSVLVTPISFRRWENWGQPPVNYCLIECYMVAMLSVFNVPTCLLFRPQWTIWMASSIWEWWPNLGARWWFFSLEQGEESGRTAGVFHLLI